MKTITMKVTKGGFTSFPKRTEPVLGDSIVRYRPVNAKEFRLQDGDEYKLQVIHKYPCIEVREKESADGRTLNAVYKAYILKEVRKIKINPRGIFANMKRPQSITV